MVRRNGIRTIDSEERDFVQTCQCKMKFKLMMLKKRTRNMKECFTKLQFTLISMDMLVSVN